MIFAFGVVFLYSIGAWFGWEVGSSGSRSRLGIPFVSTGFRGGK